MANNHRTPAVWWKQLTCWHKPKECVPHYYDYKCEKCGFLHDNGTWSPGWRSLWWWITGRLNFPQKNQP